MFLGEVVSLIGTPQQAAQQYRRLAPFAGRLGCIGTAVRHSATLELATLAARAGQPGLAAEHFAAAHDQHTRMNSSFWVAESELAWGRFLLASGDMGRCRELLRSATQRAEEKGFAAIVGEAVAQLSG